MNTKMPTLTQSALIYLIASLLVTHAAQAKETPEEHRAETVAMHQTIATAHAQAAICVAKAKDEKQEAQCHEALKTACKGVAIGKTCGMKHAH